LRFLTRIPARAAVNESVELVKHTRKRSAAALVNAVLRQGNIAARDIALESLLPADLSLADRLGILHSHPTWLVERWLARWGEVRTVAMLETNNRIGTPHGTSCAIVEESRREAVRVELARAGFKVEPGRWLRQALRVRGGNVNATKAYRHGWLAIQDEASQMIPLLLAPEPGHSVLELCAAPGGKTRGLARAASVSPVSSASSAVSISAGGEPLIVAADRHIHRLIAMRGRAHIVPGAPVHLVALDATQPLPFSARFDRILIDAPCSGTGTLARNPEIRWRLRPTDLADLQSRQQQIFLHAVEALAPGARLLYATCSLEPEENEHVLEHLLARRAGLRRVVGSSGLARHLAPGAAIHALFDSHGFFRTFPPDHATDGFFAALLEKSA
jgi:16S rRNA (cytosine967-C5)-methyltransferase